MTTTQPLYLHPALHCPSTSVKLPNQHNPILSSCVVWDVDSGMSSICAMAKTRVRCMCVLFRNKSYYFVVDLSPLYIKSVLACQVNIGRPSTTVVSQIQKTASLQRNLLFLAVSCPIHPDSLNPRPYSPIP
eukprot:2024946-Pyramimonas_sp.AAC.1